MPKVKIGKELYARVEKFAKMAGYSSVDEFVTHALEKEVSQLEGSDTEADIKKKLQGLGYIS